MTALKTGRRCRLALRVDPLATENEKALLRQGFLIGAGEGIEPLCLVCRSVSKRFVTGFPAISPARFVAMRHSDFDTFSTCLLEVFPFRSKSSI